MSLATAAYIANDEWFSPVPDGTVESTNDTTWPESLEPFHVIHVEPGEDTADDDFDDLDDCTEFTYPRRRCECGACAGRRDNVPMAWFTLA